MSDKLELEEKAVQLYTEVMRSMRAVRSAYEAAGIAVPDRVLRFLSNGAPTSTTDDQRRLLIPPPAPPPSPPEAGSGWLWVPAAEMTVVGLVKAILRRALGPLPRDVLVQELQALRESNPGSIANIGTKLEAEGVIARTASGWQLNDPSNAPVLFEGNAWGRQEFFETYEVAAHRRLCMLHVLRMQSDGLQPMQLLKQLEQCEWLKMPVTKDLIKTDLQMLDDQGKAKRVVGKSGKWRAT